MYDILNTITGHIEYCTIDRRLADKIAAPIEHYRVVDASHQGYMYRHHPRPKLGQPHPYDIECRDMQQHMRADYETQAGGDEWEVQPRWV